MSSLNRQKKDDSVLKNGFEFDRMTNPITTQVDRLLRSLTRPLSPTSASTRPTGGGDMIRKGPWCGENSVTAESFSTKLRDAQYKTTRDSSRSFTRKIKISSASSFDAATALRYQNGFNADWPKVRYLCHAGRKVSSCCGNIVCFEKCNKMECPSYAAGGHRPMRSDVTKRRRVARLRLPSGRRGNYHILRYEAQLCDRCERNGDTSRQYERKGATKKQKDFFSYHLALPRVGERSVQEGRARSVPGPEMGAGRRASERRPRFLMYVLLSPSRSFGIRGRLNR
ncbi:unnamed protein product [Nesidiocoris tenuis]|uniref:Uncharacterized protein n=1 Tax=Nesidiocoris tenuis TaxID=355587 RepID=A0A6H5HAC5_9HEMI|nr:unnamed protein product [Nesidiocoris tenuis]